MNLIEKMFGTHSERELKLIYPIVDKIVALKPEMEKLTDDELKDNTRKFRERLERVKHWMTFCRRHLPPSEKPQGVSLIWSIIRYSSLAELFCTRDVLPR